MMKPMTMKEYMEELKRLEEHAKREARTQIVEDLKGRWKRDLPWYMRRHKRCLHSEDPIHVVRHTYQVDLLRAMAPPGSSRAHGCFDERP